MLHIMSQMVCLSVVALELIDASSKQPCTNLTQYSCKIGGVRFECTCQPRRAITAGIVFLCMFATFQCC